MGRLLFPVGLVVILLACGTTGASSLAQQQATPIPLPTYTLYPTLTPHLAPTPYPTYTPFPMPTAVPEPAAPATWTTYRNNVFGYVLDNAPGWTTDDSLPGQVIVQGPGGQGEILILERTIPAEPINTPILRDGRLQYVEFQEGLEGVVDSEIARLTQGDSSIVLVSRSEITLPSGLRAVRVVYQSQSYPGGDLQECIERRVDFSLQVGPKTYWGLDATLCEDDLPAYQGTVEAMQESFALLAPAPIRPTFLTYTSSDGRWQIDYPFGAFASPFLALGPSSSDAIEAMGFFIQQTPPALGGQDFSSLTLSVFRHDGQGSDNDLESWSRKAVASKESSSHTYRLVSKEKVKVGGMEAYEVIEFFRPYPDSIPEKEIALHLVVGPIAYTVAGRIGDWPDAQVDPWTSETKEFIRVVIYSFQPLP